ncbi:acyl-CoA thioesterase [Glaciimonas immobilis]|uniref:Acyl-CoA thioester hydrolase n=1 Tax=Glaciimonas immobilis TaxID=728004 RepID=A0A840RJ63_9BURK|nr:acyl-CoA thioesterase [Glaciimonas immobilis]KAF3998838.1 acyl-CoA thioesterase [Glaciimonas immobilis]MBB5198227.1 acyl-CoA thioester hydrolase [Glaciimonas immobilis]
MHKKESRWAAEVTLQIQFYDLDPMEIVWHGNYVKYMEQARCTLLDSIGYNYVEMKESGYAWPVIDLHLRYVQSATFGQHIRVQASIVAWENSLKIDYLISDSVSGRRLTKGSTTQVAVAIATRELCFTSPAILFEKLGIPAP